MTTLVHLAGLAFAAAAGGAPAAHPSAQATYKCSVRADSATESQLTAEQLTRFIELRKALGPYWHAESRAELLKTAKATAHKVAVHMLDLSLDASVYDYPSLIKQDTGLAAIFTKNQLSPAQFEPVQVAVWQAMLMLNVVAQDSSIPLPAETTTLGKNIALVKSRQQDLIAAGVKATAKMPGRTDLSKMVPNP